MTSKLEKLKNLNNEKLIDVVKNYRQFGYDEETRKAAIEILESRGIDMETLKIRGDFENKSYDDAIEYFKSYDNNSKIALVLYIIMIVSRILVFGLPDSNNFLISAFLIFFWLTLIGYLIYFIKAFISQTKYFNLIGKDEYGLGLNANLYFIVGPFIYLIMYFIFRKQIKEQSNQLR
jgi:hypothetical protein